MAKNRLYGAGFWVVNNPTAANQRLYIFASPDFSDPAPPTSFTGVTSQLPIEITIAITKLSGYDSSTPEATVP